MRRTNGLLAAWFCAAALSACGGGISPPASIAGSQIPARAPIRPLARKAVGPFANLYVANFGNNTVTVYAPGAILPLRTISAGISYPSALAFDSLGNLYVINYSFSPSGGYVTVYAPGSTSVSETISVYPYSLAIDRHDDLYVGTQSSVYVFAPGTASPKQTITQGIDVASGMAFDSLGNLFVANNYNSTVTVYRPGDRVLIRTISRGLIRPYALTLDAADNLYVAGGVDPTYYFFGTVTVYARGAKRPLRTLDGVSGASDFAFNPSGNLFVANCGEYCGGAFNGDVTAYLPGSKSPFRTISQDILSPRSLAFSPTGNLFVANYDFQINGSVTVYAYGKKRLLRTITQGISLPISIAFGP